MGALWCAGAGGFCPFRFLGPSCLSSTSRRRLKSDRLPLDDRPRGSQKPTFGRRSELCKGLELGEGTTTCPLFAVSLGGLKRNTYLEKARDYSDQPRITSADINKTSNPSKDAFDTPFARRVSAEP